jgi:hypothetical protein
MLKKLGIAFGLLAIFSFANAQQWPNVPTLGGPSYCSSTVNGVCVNTVPAGPSMTGAETVPADTNASQGQSPQTVKVPLSLLNSGPYQYVAPLTGASITLAAVTRQLLIDPAGTISAFTVVFPAATGLLDNQRVGICTTQIITTLTITNGSGATVLNPPTAMLVPVATGAASCVAWLYRAANTSWYRIQ